MSRPTCQSCDFWNPTVHQYGDCQHDPPVVAPAHLHGQSELPNLGWWPATHQTDWCGQHQHFYAVIPPVAPPLGEKMRADLDALKEKLREENQS